MAKDISVLVTVRSEVVGVLAQPPLERGAELLGIRLPVLLGPPVGHAPENRIVLPSIFDPGEDALPSAFIVSPTLLSLGLPILGASLFPERVLALPVRNLPLSADGTKSSLPIRGPETLGVLAALLALVFEDGVSVSLVVLPFSFPKSPRGPDPALLLKLGIPMFEVP